MNPYGEPVLECQDCGDVLKRLTPEENQRVAANPHSFIVYCGRCRAGALRHAAARWGVHPENLREFADHLYVIGAALTHDGRPL